MARTPEGPASAKPLIGLTGKSNLEPYQLIDFVDVIMSDDDEIYASSFEEWLYWRKIQSFEAVAPYPHWDESPPTIGGVSIDDLDHYD